MEKYLTAMPAQLHKIHPGECIVLPSVADRGALVSLEPYIVRDGLDPSAVFYASEYDAFVWDGQAYGLPLDVSGSYLYFWDKDQFAEAGLDPERPPRTWDELEEFAKKLTVKNPDGSFERIGFHAAAVSNSPFLVWLYLNRHGCTPMTSRSSFRWSRRHRGMEWIVGLADRLYGGYNNILPYLGDATDNGWHVTGLFYTGKVASHISGVWHFAQLAANAPNKNYGVAVLPHNGDNPDAKLCQPVSGGWSYAIPVGAKNPDAAWKFIKYATAEEGSLNFFLAQQRPSASPVVNADPRFASDNPHWSAVLETLANREFVPVIPIHPQILAVIKEMTELAIRGRMSPADAVNWGAQEVQRLLDSYYSE